MAIKSSFRHSPEGISCRATGTVCVQVRAKYLMYFPSLAGNLYMTLMYLIVKLRDPSATLIDIILE